MYEDSDVELAAFAPGARVFTIASAGCTSFALAAHGCAVTAVDVNPAQVDYVRARMLGAPVLRGSAERLLDTVRRIALLAGWRRSLVEAFCALDDVDQQRSFWRDRLDTRRFRLGLALAFRTLALRTVYSAPLASVLPQRFDRVLRMRLERGFARHPNRTNPYARLLLLGDTVPAQPREDVRLEVTLADAAAHLEGTPPGSFDGFALSNILDGADSAYADRLLTAVRRAAAPGAMLVLRSLREPAVPAEAEVAARDRSLIWGGIRVDEAV
jgi:S-adenosylmethionine:diacylglycerol 3-amino-3-carboxypropyl transferase